MFFVLFQGVFFIFIFCMAEQLVCLESLRHKHAVQQARRRGRIEMKGKASRRGAFTQSKCHPLSPVSTQWWEQKGENTLWGNVFAFGFLRCRAGMSCMKERLIDSQTLRHRHWASGGVARGGHSLGKRTSWETSFWGRGTERKLVIRLDWWHKVHTSH